MLLELMHNLLLGAAHILSVWISEGLLDKEHLDSIQSKVGDVGRIPSNNFSGFTAEQWRN